MMFMIRLLQHSQNHDRLGPILEPQLNHQTITNAKINANKRN